MHTNEKQEVIYAYGHKNIQATHKATLEVTKDKHLSKSGDCIIAVAADKALADLTKEFKEKLKKPNAKLTIQIQVGDLFEQVQAFGSPQLILTHPTDIVVRKSNHISDRTIAICADKAAKDLPRAMVDALKNPEQKAKIILTVSV